MVGEDKEIFDPNNTHVTQVTTSPHKLKEQGSEDEEGLI